MNWEPNTELDYYFTPTRFDRASEIRKAEIKNHNLPILQHWFHGNKKTTLKCLITKISGFTKFPDIVTGQQKQRFILDFNHIRQKLAKITHCGISIDKGKYGPSDIIRSFRLDEKPCELIEMMTTMPIHCMYHSFISQDSQKANITLNNFKKSWWPWGLKNEGNFNKFCKEYSIENLNYYKFINALSKITESCSPITKQWAMGKLK
jgi:hypothetical protein